MLGLCAPGRAGPGQRHATIANAAQPTVQSRKALRAPKRYSVTEVSGSQERAVLGIGESTSAADRLKTGSPPSPAASHEPLTLSLSALPTSIRDLFLPPGYPASVTPDYLPYQLWSVPTHITGHLSHALVTSSLLSAVGLSAGPAATAALSASIKWIVKDGVGALGRLIVGSRFSVEFDEDPRRWRMVAELLSTAGMGLEVCTMLVPQHFLALACGGKFMQALGKGMGKPVFRVIQTHFAVAQNVGAVAAKEEVWEVVAQMAGLACSVALLSSLEATGKADSVLACWAAIQGVHVALRYAALRALAFPSLSTKRAALLAAASVAGEALPGVAEGNAREASQVLTDPRDVSPRMVLGCSAGEAFGGPPAAERLAACMELYGSERYVLVRRDGVSYVMLKEGHTGRDVLRAIWQAAWLDRHEGREPQLPGVAAGAAGGASNGNGSGLHGLGGVEVGSSGAGEPGLNAGCRERAVAAGLGAEARSLDAVGREFEGFMAECAARGWDTGVVLVKLGTWRLRVAEVGTGETA